jgi:hypothetical protein
MCGVKHLQGIDDALIAQELSGAAANGVTSRRELLPTAQIAMPPHEHTPEEVHLSVIPEQGSVFHKSGFAGTDAFGKVVHPSVPVMQGAGPVRLSVRNVQQLNTPPAGVRGSALSGTRLTHPSAAHAVRVTGEDNAGVLSTDIAHARAASAPPLLVAGTGTFAAQNGHEPHPLRASNSAGASSAPSPVLPIVGEDRVVRSVPSQVGNSTSFAEHTQHPSAARTPMIVTVLVSCSTWHASAPMHMEASNPAGIALQRMGISCMKKLYQGNLTGPMVRMGGPQSYKYCSLGTSVLQVLLIGYLSPTNTAHWVPQSYKYCSLGTSVLTYCLVRTSVLQDGASFQDYRLQNAQVRGVCMHSVRSVDR